jgi:hypothetical protein
MSLENYENYYQYCIQHNKNTAREGCNNENKKNNITKFQFASSNRNNRNHAALGQMSLQNDLNNAIKNDRTFNTTSYKALQNIDGFGLANFDYFVNSDTNPHIFGLNLKAFNFECDLEMHRAYIYQNSIPNNTKAEDLNCNVYHWKNEPKTIVTVYINLDYLNKKPFMSLLYNPKHDKYITMKTTRN